MRQHSGCGLGPADHAVPRKWQVTGKAIGRSGPGSLNRLHRGLSAYAALQVRQPVLRVPALAREPIIKVGPVGVRSGSDPEVAAGIAHGGSVLVQAPG